MNIKVTFPGDFEDRAAALSPEALLQVSSCIGTALTDAAAADDGNTWELHVYVPTAEEEQYAIDPDLRVHGFLISMDRTDAGYCSENAFYYMKDGTPELYL